MAESFPWIVTVLGVLALVGLLSLVLLLRLLWRPQDDSAVETAVGAVEELGRRLEALGRSADERLSRELRGDVQDTARSTRQELAQTLSLFQTTLMSQSGDVARTQNEQIDSFRVQLASLQESIGAALQGATHALGQNSQSARQAQDIALQRFGDTLVEQLRTLGEQNDLRLAETRRLMEDRLGALQTGIDQRLTGLQTGTEQRLKTLQEGVEQRLAAVQTSVEQRLTSLQADNEKKLEQMRATVDEKLHATLEQRLGESFKQVADRLEQVHRGLGEMQTLAQGVGDLKRVLTNVKSRGIFGEVQLAALLEQVFTTEQYATNVATVPGSSERVEFAIRLPGRGTHGGANAGIDDAPVWLPIDAKFPREDYERLLEAQDRADREAAEVAGKALEARIRDEARSIATKYLAPPHTTDFALLFVPTEGLYAELLRRPGLSELLQRQFRVTLAGPTTLLAMLNSLQMGFRTLALEKRSSEVWKVLGAVKTEFGKFGDVLEKTRKKLQEASNTIESAEVRTRAMARQLRGVEGLPDQEAQALVAAGEASPRLRFDPEGEG